MHSVPHTYTAAATIHPGGDALVGSPHLTTFRSAPSVEFGGAGDRWSPETLFLAAVADGFVLTFRAIANAAHFPWQSLACDVTGHLDRSPEAPRFTDLQIRARLGVSDGALLDRGNGLLLETEKRCVITRSLSASTHLEAEVHLVEPAAWDPAV